MLLLLFISITCEQAPQWDSADGLCNQHQRKGPGNKVGIVHQGDSHNNGGGGCSLGVLERNPIKRNQDPVLWAWLEILAPMKDILILKQHIIPCHFFFSFINTLKCTAKASTVSLNTLERYQRPGPTPTPLIVPPGLYCMLQGNISQAT